MGYVGPSLLAGYLVHIAPGCPLMYACPAQAARTLQRNAQRAPTERVQHGAMSRARTDRSEGEGQIVRRRWSQTTSCGEVFAHDREPCGAREHILKDSDELEGEIRIEAKLTRRRRACAGPAAQLRSLRPRPRLVRQDRPPSLRVGVMGHRR
jgi:hypothetical protein